MSEHVFVYGNPLVGLNFIGPVNPDDTDLEEEFHNETWWYAKMESRRDVVGPTEEDLEQDDVDVYWADISSLICEAEELFSAHGGLVEPGMELKALTLLRDIVENWRELPPADE